MTGPVTGRDDSSQIRTERLINETIFDLLKLFETNNPNRKL
jgi:hypothetical protein